MFEKLKVLAARLDELEMRLSAPDLYDDPDRAAKLLRERNELEPIVTAFREYEQAQRTLADATEMLSDPDMKELAQEELQQAKSDIARLEDELKILLLPKDPNDEKNIYVEIRGGAGGEESALFAADLYRMYTMYADKRGWQTEVMNKSETELGGYKEIVFRVAGDKVYSRLKFESGVHRVQSCARDRKSGPRAHLDNHRGCPSRSGGTRLLYRPEGFTHRHVPRLRRGRPAHQQDLVRHPRDAYPDQHGRRVSGRAQPAQEQGESAVRAAFAAVRGRGGKAACRHRR